MGNNWMEMLANPKGLLVKNYMLQILGQERFLKHENFIERLAVMMQTTSDIKELGEVVVSIYENGYYKALNDSRDQLKKLGYDVSVKRETAAGSH